MISSSISLFDFPYLTILSQICLDTMGLSVFCFLKNILRKVRDKIFAGTDFLKLKKS
jgi:hypothetical protein